MSVPQPPQDAPAPPPSNPSPPTAPPPDCGPVRPPGTNPFSIASLICGIVAPCGAGLFSVVFGIIALVQVRKSGQRGKRMAIAGLVITGVWVLVPVTGGIFALLNSDPLRDDTGEIVRDGSVSMDELAPGDCIKELGPGVSFRVPVVPCAELHEGEVYAVFDLTADGGWPGEETVAADAQTSCVDRLADYARTGYDDSDMGIFYYHPTSSSWRGGDREVVCVAYFRDGERAGSIAG
ncbi:DUF4190 domain-containing protein [Natronosporangium hydrolyticum]|uniref:DUF4190 domain-containing protein n=1 Tax=Natronosporangium hydrolyticum TaxID=2811111 RepID=A0A895YGW7_9ACTN|nr:DUF4190 domain-containing protein [Natronosporangium hydrolyticum]QSB16801.1 DUF4190 domain-containing protein [Natronosporangium hydrolyticum]